MYCWHSRLPYQSWAGFTSSISLASAKDSPSPFCQWVIAALGYIGIVYVMFSGARRLEMRQTETYGSDPEFQAYIKKNPLIIPFVPIYSVAKYKWLQA